jgi:hypothetical protein
MVGVGAGTARGEGLACEPISRSDGPLEEVGSGVFLQAKTTPNENTIGR